MYQPKLARFMWRDPLPENGPDIFYPVPDMRQFASSQRSFEQPYVYVQNDPVNCADPSGLDGGPSHPYPKFPGSQKCDPASDNVGTLLGINCCLLTPRTKEERKRLPQPPPKKITGPIPIGPLGGSHKFCGHPIANTGAGGCGPCIGLVIKCPPKPGSNGGVAIFHFKVGDDPCSTIGTWDWHGCDAIMCGGVDEHQSMCLAEWVIKCAALHGLGTPWISASDACGITPDGEFYEK